MRFEGPDLNGPVYCSLLNRDDQKQFEHTKKNRQPEIIVVLMYVKMNLGILAEHILLQKTKAHKPPVYSWLTPAQNGDFKTFENFTSDG